MLFSRKRPGETSKPVKETQQRLIDEQYKESHNDWERVLVLSEGSCNSLSFGRSGVNQTRILRGSTGCLKGLTLMNKRV